MKRVFLLIIILAAIISGAKAQYPKVWESRGAGGGGAFFSPSINPANDNEYYVSSDMTGLYHTTDFGNSYTMLHFKKIQASVNSALQFTNSSGLVYCIDATDDILKPVKSTDNGETWTELSGNPYPTDNSFNLFVDYDNPQRIILSFWLDAFISTDGGSNFTKIYTGSDNGAGLIIGGVFFDGNTIIMGTNEGLLVSENGGSSFSIKSINGIPSDESISSFSGSKQNGKIRLFCLTGNVSDNYLGKQGYDYWGFFRGIYTLDYPGNTWKKSTVGIDTVSDFLMYVASAKNDINTVYAAGSNDSGEPEVYISTNAGQSWSNSFKTTSNANIFTGWSGYAGDRPWGYGECVLGIAVAPNNSQKVVITDLGFVHKTSDGGQTWYQAYVSPADQNQANNNTVQKKSYHSNGLENTSCWQVLWINENEMFAGFTDMTALRSTDAGKTWGFNFIGNTYNTNYRIEKSVNNLYAATSTVHDLYESSYLRDVVIDKPNGGSVMYSADKGVTWTKLHEFNAPVYWVTLDAMRPYTLYASVVNHKDKIGGIYVTNELNKGSSAKWTKLPDPPRTENHPAAIISLKDGMLLCSYSGRIDSTGKFTSSSGVFLYDPSSTKWQDVSAPEMKYWTKDIILDPQDQNQSTWYACVYSGWGGAPNGLGGLYKTTNRGASWTRIFKSDRVASCTISSTNPDLMFVSTETQGLWYSKDLHSEGAFFKLVDTYPFRHPERVFFNPFNTNEIWVTSFGNGLRVGSLVTDAEEPEIISTVAQIYPNPASDWVRLDYVSDGVATAEIDLLNIMGQQLEKRLCTTVYGHNQLSLNISGYDNGIYFLRIKTGKNTFNQKFIILK